MGGLVLWPSSQKVEALPQQQRRLHRRLLGLPDIYYMFCIDLWIELMPQEQYEIAKTSSAVGAQGALLAVRQ